MKKVFPIVAILLAGLFAGCDTKCIEDSGKHVSKVSHMSSFDEIKVNGAMKLILKQDSSYDVKIQADSNVMGMIRAKVSGSELNIKLEDGKYCGSDSIVVYVGVGELKALNVNGMVEVAGEGVLYAKDVKLNLSGSSELNLNLNVAKLVTKIDGVGKLTLSGQAGTHELKTSGTARIDAFNFITGVYNIDIDGTTKANVNVLNDLKVKTSGSSEIYYKGNPKHVDEKKSGAAKLEKVN